MPTPKTNALATTAKVAVSGGLLALLFSNIDTVRLAGYLRGASLSWLCAALGLYAGMIFASAWRWGLLLGAQGIRASWSWLVNSFFVATFFNNFLPSNIGGDVIRIRDTAGPAGSKTLATTIVLIDRGIGLLGLVLVAAVGATLAVTVGSDSPVVPSLLWGAFAVALAASIPALISPDGVRRALQPLTRIHADWVGQRIEQIAEALARFRGRPDALLGCLLGAVLVQAILITFYLAVAWAMHIAVTPLQLAVIVPVSFVVQMVPVSVNGFGVREATFAFYFTRLGLPVESGLMVSLVGTAVIMVLSLAGAAAYVRRR